GQLRSWELAETGLLTSAYAAEEARRNLDSPEQRMRLEALLARTEIVPESTASLPPGLGLSDKDPPILKAALAAAATHLVTGDVRDFGRFFGKKALGILIVTPSDLLRSWPDRIRRRRA